MEDIVDKEFFVQAPSMFFWIQMGVGCPIRAFVGNFWVAMYLTEGVHGIWRGGHIPAVAAARVIIHLEDVVHHVAVHAQHLGEGLGALARLFPRDESFLNCVH